MMKYEKRKLVLETIAKSPFDVLDGLSDRELLLWIINSLEISRDILKD